MFFKYSQVNNRLFYNLIMPIVTACCLLLNGCQKIVKVSDPINTITTKVTFNNEADAKSALAGLYFNLIRGYNSTFDIGNGRLTAYAGLSADELLSFNTDPNVIQYQTNTLLSSNNDLSSFFWNAAYYDIYIANSVIEGTQASTTLSDAVKNQLTGEAKFVRAYIYFYMTNLFGDVPLVTTTAWNTSSLLPRSSSAQVYDLIKADLNAAKELLPDDYLNTNGSRIHANKSAATALLARVYLFQKNWSDAISQADLVIGSPNAYSLTSEPNDVFSPSSSEAILQLEVSDAYSPYATKEGNQFIPTNRPTYYLTNQLLASFEPNDRRYDSWVKSITYQSKTYYYPYKYKVRQGSAGGGVTEYYMLLRLAEQYLIKAEALAHSDQLEPAINNLNIIRERAGLADLDLTLDQDAVFAAIAQERRIEYFAEWGHRWFDLVRTSQADAVLSSLKTEWKPTATLFPIPRTEMNLDPMLTQNPGYN